MGDAWMADPMRTAIGDGYSSNIMSLFGFMKACEGQLASRRA